MALSSAAIALSNTSTSLRQIGGWCVREGLHREGASAHRSLLLFHMLACQDVVGKDDLCWYLLRILYVSQLLDQDGLLHPGASMCWEFSVLGLKKVLHQPAMLSSLYHIGKPRGVFSKHVDPPAL